MAIHKVNLDIKPVTIHGRFDMRYKMIFYQTYTDCLGRIAIKQTSAIAKSFINKEKLINDILSDKNLELEIDYITNQFCKEAADLSLKGYSPGLFSISFKENDWGYEVDSFDVEHIRSVAKEMHIDLSKTQELKF